FLELILQRGFAELLVSHGVEVHGVAHIANVHEHLRSEEDQEFFSVHDFMAAAEEVSEEWQITQYRDFFDAFVICGADEAAKENGLAALHADRGGSAALVNDRRVHTRRDQDAGAGQRAIGRADIHLDRTVRTDARRDAEVDPYALVFDGADLSILLGNARIGNKRHALTHIDRRRLIVGC